MHFLQLVSDITYRLAPKDRGFHVFAHGFTCRSQPKSDTHAVIHTSDSSGTIAYSFLLEFMNQRPKSHYDPVSQVFHWLTAAIVLAAFILGPEHFDRLIRQGVDPATRIDIVWHESLGVLVMALTLLRLVWVSIRSGPPDFQMAHWMRVTGKLVHGVLWALLLALPLSALLALGSEDIPLTLLGGFRVELLPWVKSSGIGVVTDWGDVHQFLGDAILWLAGFHAAAAIYHHVVLKDGVLKAMMRR
jgi:cytochrome b561